MHNLSLNVPSSHRIHHRGRSDARQILVFKPVVALAYVLTLVHPHETIIIKHSTGVRECSENAMAESYSDISALRYKKDLNRCQLLRGKLE